MVVSLHNLSIFEAIQTQLGDRFKPFLASPATLASVSRTLTDWVSQNPSSATLFISVPNAHSWSEVAPYYEALARSVRSVYILSKDSLYTSVGNLYCCRLALDSKLQQEYVLGILAPELSCILVGQQLSHTSGSDAFSHCVTYYSYAPESIAPALEVLQQAIGQSKPALKPQLQACCQETVPCPPSPAAASAIIPPLLQLLDTAIQQKSQLQRQSQHLENLQQVNDELQKSLQFKDEFMALVSQQLCNPLTNIKTAIQLLRSPRIKDAQKDKYWDVLQTECNQQVNLINSLVELTSLDDPTPTDRDCSTVLFDLVPGIVSTYQAVAREKGVMLAYTVPSALPKVNFPAAALKQILVKLIENGLECTLEGGKIWVTATANGNYVQLEIRDTGIGIPSEALPKLFDRFYRIPRSHFAARGVGLGLTIAQKLVLQYGGSISVRSQLDRGSTFTVLLPQVDRS
ncbi:ATP-binding protein [Synechococcus sp. PCC 7336]|uniref:ATP-binding protein n=1 Tax=Synechococcus sp. PCC 7336 TaxID=195250 RepID=UPI00035C75BF|nr:ATP-binding protein [Synechococcus sp. PCC 7336]